MLHAAPPPHRPCTPGLETRAGKKAGEPIDGRYMVFFDQRKVTSTAQGLITCVRACQGNV
jgi:hypothetical protein